MKNFSPFAAALAVIFLVWLAGCRQAPLEINRFITGRYAVVPYEQSILIVDINRPDRPRLAASLLIGSPIRQVVLFDRYAAVLRQEVYDYSAAGAIAPGGIAFVDLSRPQAPQIVGQIDRPAYPNTLFVSGSTGYTADFEKLYRLNLTNPAVPTITEETPLDGGSGHQVFVPRGETVWTMGASCSFRTGGCRGQINRYRWENDRLAGQETTGISVPVYDAAILNETLYTIGQGFAAAPADEPTLLGLHHQQENFAFYQGKIVGHGDHLYATADHRLLVLETTDPLNPRPIGLEDSAPEGTYFVDLAAVDQYIILVSQFGLHVIDVSRPAQPRGAAFLPFAGSN